MHDSLQELENELKALKPRSASPHWLQQINRELAAELPAATKPVYATSTNLSSWKWWGWRLAATAAVVAVIAAGVFQVRRTTATPAATELALQPPVALKPAHVYEAVAATNVLYDLKDEGAVAGNDAARQVRARYVDTYTWKNPRTNASIKWTVPRDEIRVVPATYRQN